MPKIGAVRPVAESGPRLTLSDLLDPRKLAEFTGWPFEDEERPIIRNCRPTGYCETVPAAQVIAERLVGLYRELGEEWAKSAHNQFRQPATHAQYIQQCIREEREYQASLKKRRRKYASRIPNPAKVQLEKDKKARKRLTDGKPMPKPSDIIDDINSQYGYRRRPSDYGAFLRWCVKEEFDLTCDIQTAREILCKRFPDRYFPPEKTDA